MNLEAAELADMAVDVASQPDAAWARDRIVRHAQRIFGPDGVTMLGRHRKRPVVTAIPLEAACADELQLTADEGPSLAAAQDGQLYVCESIDTDPRWPTWGRRAAELGWRSGLNAPLRFGSHTLGVLSLYARKPTSFEQTFVDAVQVYTAQAATILSQVMRAAQLQEAIGSRHLIGQAQGILMQQHDIDADVAFQLMRRHSQDHNIKLHTVAKIIIATRCAAPRRSDTRFEPAAEPRPPSAAAADASLVRQLSKPGGRR